MQQSNNSLVKSLTIKDDFAPLLKLTVPLVLTGVMQASMSFFENIFLARLGPQILAAGALVSWLFATLIVVLFGTFSSVNILIAHKYGAKETASIACVLRDGLMLAVLLVIPTFLLLWNMAPIFLVLGQSPKLVTLATAYLHALSWGILPKFILIVLIEMLLGLGHARTITSFTMLTIPIYIFFSYVLIFGKFGFPALGIAGAGWGMTIGDWIATTFLSIYIFTSKRYRSYLTCFFSFNRPFYLWEILHIGIPMGAMYCVEVGFFFVMTLFMGLIGIHILAANQVTMQYLAPLMGTVFSIAQAVTVRMSHQLGANQPASAERTSYAGVFLTAVYMSVIAAIYWIFPYVLISVDFNIHAPENFETVQFAKQFLFIAAFFQIFEAIRIVLFGALRSLKDTRFTLLTSIISFWCIALPIGYLFSFYLQLGGKGFWWGMVVGASVNVAILYRRLGIRLESWMKLTR